MGHVKPRLLLGYKEGDNARFRVAFYNLENLFDTVDGPNDDAEFLPSSANQWNTERYQSKLKNMAKVIDSIAPDILGVVEVENAFVLEDLRKHCYSYVVFLKRSAVANDDREANWVLILKLCIVNLRMCVGLMLR
jgi:hypothetical protein